MAENMSSSDSHIDTVEAILYRKGARKMHPVTMEDNYRSANQPILIGNPELTNQTRTLGSDW